MAACTCAQCGEAFGSVSAFDQHQDVDFKRPRRQQVICRAPGGVGLIQGNDGRWRIPLSAAGAAHYENLRAERARGGITGRGASFRDR